jgi:nicotinamide mononucleotide transporter
MPNVFSASQTFVTIHGYEMSYLEFFGTLLNLASVWLVARRNVLTWPVGIAGVVLFSCLFYQIHLYSDFFEQIYFFATGAYGWWVWTRLIAGGEGEHILHLSPRAIALAIAIVALGTVALGELMSHIDQLLPRFFPEPASYPYTDAFTTVMSFVAQLLLAHKKIENWILWILVDVIGIWLYWIKDVPVIAVLYVFFLFLACRGLVEWRRALLLERDGTPVPSEILEPAHP